MAAPQRSPWAPSLPLLVGLAMFVVAGGVSSQRVLGDPDSHWLVTVGNWILAHGTVPTTDSFSFTFGGPPWIAKEWLSQVLLVRPHVLAFPLVLLSQLERWAIDWTLLRSDLPANRLLERLAGWRRAYRDDTATIFVRER